MSDKIDIILNHFHNANRHQLIAWPEPKFVPGDQFKALVPFSETPLKVHIDHVFPSIYAKWNVVYRVYGKHKQWWHEFMCTENDMLWYMEKTKPPLERKSPSQLLSE